MSGSLPAKAERQGQGPVDRATPKRVWMLSFEASDIAQLGGLGSAVTSLARAMAREREVSVLMPSHGRHLDVRLEERLALREIREFVSQGQRRGADGSFHPYRIGMVKGHLEGVSYCLAKGLDHGTSQLLDDPRIYDGELTYQKISLFARAARGYLDFILRAQPEMRPDLVHAHDWHSVPAAIALKQAFLENNLNVPLVFTVHLLSHKGLPWHYFSEDWCGIRDELHPVIIDGMRRPMTYRDVCDDLSNGEFEEFGAYEADFITSVSESYLRGDVLPYLGTAGLKKSGVIYNGCDWDEKKMVRKAIAYRNAGIAAAKPVRSDLRRYLLTRALGERENPEISEESPGMAVENRQGARPRPFNDDGPLVLMTGRLDPQKGVDVLLKAVPEVLEVFPAARFLFLLLPLSGDLVSATLLEAKVHENNVRVLLGRAGRIYGLAHVSADAYAMPSRWEPFGISALEAMATGNPVVGTRVGGMTETVLDIIDSGKEGTGRLVPREDFRELARGLVCFLAIMQIDEEERRGVNQDRRRLLDAIAYDPIREHVIRNPTWGSTVRENCRRRVETHFRPSNAVQMALKAYDAAASNSNRRMAPV